MSNSVRKFKQTNLIMEAILEILITAIATNWKKVGKVFFKKPEVLSHH
jgi:hypothetical protein